jgi:hypothetical protein
LFIISFCITSIADVWSIGITAIELADKNPPMSDIHPMRALHLIPEADPQTLMLQQPKKWSKAFIQFIQHCLIKNPTQRPTAESALQHPWFNKINTLTQQMQDKPMIQRLIQESARDKKMRDTKNMGKPPNKRQPMPNLEQEDSSDEEEEIVLDQVNNIPNSSSSPQTPALAIHPVAGDAKPDYLNIPTDRSSTGQASTRSSISVVSPSSSSTFLQSFMNVLKPRRNRSRSDASSDSEMDPTVIEEEVVDVTQELMHLKMNANQKNGERKVPAVVQPSVENNQGKDEDGPHVASEVPFDLVPLNVQLRVEILCADIVTIVTNQKPQPVVQQTFMLLGTEKGLYAVQLSAGNQHLRMILANDYVFMINMTTQFQ